MSGRADHINRNYASTFPLLDRLFGTYYLPQSWPDDYGVQQEAQESAVAVLSKAGTVESR